MASHRRSKRYNRGIEPGFRESRQPDSSQSTHAPMGVTGLAVFRKIDFIGPIHEPWEVFEATTSGWPRRLRGLGGQAEPALSQLALHEVKKNQQVLGSLVAPEVKDQLYKEVRSLRRPVTVKLGSVGLFGARDKPTSPIGIALDPESSEMINAERQQIIDIIDELAYENTAGQCFWLDRLRPHITLGFIEKDVPPYMLSELKAKVKEAAPAELKINRASFYIPVSN